MRLSLSAFSFVLTLVSCGQATQSGLLANRQNPQRNQQGGGRFPIAPDLDVTPGTVCEKPDRYRYPEQIAYCERDVASSLKRDIMVEYDQRFGYEITKMERGEFKIDHFIPLCMGGSNERTNLWPQHRSVYEVTDPFEQKLCEFMAQGEMKQAEAMEIIRHLKFHLDEAPDISRELAAR